MEPITLERVIMELPSYENLIYRAALVAQLPHPGAQVKYDGTTFQYEDMEGNEAVILFTQTGKYHAYITTKFGNNYSRVNFSSVDNRWIIEPPMFGKPTDSAEDFIILMSWFLIPRIDLIEALRHPSADSWSVTDLLKVGTIFKDEEPIILEKPDAFFIVTSATTDAGLAQGKSLGLIPVPLTYFDESRS